MSESEKAKGKRQKLNQLRKIYTIDNLLALDFRLFPMVKKVNRFPTHRIKNKLV